MKLKSLILTFTLSLFALSGLLAQDKYEYAKVQATQFTAKGGKIYIVKSTGEEVIEYKETRSDIPLLGQVEKMVAEGWELVFINNETYSIIYHLRKKKNQ